MIESTTRLQDAHERKRWKFRVLERPPIVTPFLINSLFFVATLSLGGCSGLYFHNQPRENQAKKAYESFKTIRENASVENLMASYADQRTSEMELISFISTVDDGTQLSTLHDMTWVDLEKKTKDLLDDTENSLKNAEGPKKDSEKQLTEALNKLPLIQKKGASLLEAMNEAALAQARFVATQFLLQESLLLTLEKDTEISNTSAQDRLDKLDKTTIPVTNFSVNKNNQLIENTPQPKSINELLGVGLPFKLLATEKLDNSNDSQEEIKTILSNLLKGDSLKSVNLVLQNPGTSVTTLGLLQDFARAEEERTKVEIEYAKQVISLLETNIAFLEEYKTRLKDDLNPDSLGIAGASSIVRNRKDTVGHTLASFATRCQKSPLRSESPACLNFRALYRALEFNYQNRVSDAKKGDELNGRLAALDSRKALDMARVQVLEREAVISRGLDGLVAFHKGGIDENDVRNIIAIAQAIGVSVIAGGVY